MQAPPGNESGDGKAPGLFRNRHCSHYSCRQPNPLVPGAGMAFSVPLFDFELQDKNTRRIVKISKRGIDLPVQQALIGKQSMAGEESCYNRLIDKCIVDLEFIPK